METWRRCPSCYLLLAFDPWLPQIKAAVLPPYAWGCASLFRLNTIAVQSGAFFFSLQVYHDLSCGLSTYLHCSGDIQPCSCCCFQHQLTSRTSSSWACSGTAGRNRGDALEPCSLGTEGKQVSRAGAAGVRGFCCPVTGRPRGTESSRRHRKDSRRLPYACPFAVHGGA